MRYNLSKAERHRRRKQGGITPFYTSSFRAPRDLAYWVLQHRCWGNDGACPGSGAAEKHWGYYLIESQGEWDYWHGEHIDEAHQCYWRHDDFISIPCAKCGAYSPLRCQKSYGPAQLVNWKGEPIAPHKSDNPGSHRSQLRNYHPGDEWPDSIGTYSENGWFYKYFKASLSDSLDGQETFRLRRDPETLQ